MNWFSKIWVKDLPQPERLGPEAEIDPAEWDHISGGESDPGGVAPVGSLSTGVGRGGLRLF